ncbi:MAG: molybdopterin molybdotransferase MoeA, partial [Planctomycetota bacterium]
MTDSPRPDADVRMRGFARRTTVADAMAWLDGQTARLAHESVPVPEADGRVLARAVKSEVDVPRFARSMMDGFAVRASDTLGASAYNRLALEVIGESLPGRPFEGTVSAGEAVRIMTGAPLPKGADAVLPVEVVEIQADRILAQAEVSPQKHVGRIGEDIAAGAGVLSEGRVLRPQDVGVLASIGVGKVPVVRRPRVRIVVTGDELLPAGSRPEGYRIVDSNGPMLAALVRRDGGVPIHPGIVPDE